MTEALVFTGEVVIVLLMGVLVLSLIALAFGIYMWPTIVASYHRRADAPMIAVINICFGWSFIAWILCFVWAIAPYGRDNMRENGVYANHHYEPGPQCRCGEEMFWDAHNGWMCPECDDRWDEDDEDEDL